MDAAERERLIAQYEDGYQSFSPGYSFEVGYTKVDA